MLIAGYITKPIVVAITRQKWLSNLVCLFVWFLLGGWGYCCCCCCFVEQIQLSACSKLIDQYYLMFVSNLLVTPTKVFQSVYFNEINLCVPMSWLKLRTFREHTRDFFLLHCSILYVILAISNMNQCHCNGNWVCSEKKMPLHMKYSLKSERLNSRITIF